MRDVKQCTYSLETSEKWTKHIWLVFIGESSEGNDITCHVLYIT